MNPISPRALRFNNHHSFARATGTPDPLASRLVVNCTSSRPDAAWRRRTAHSDRRGRAGSSTSEQGKRGRRGPGKRGAHLREHGEAAGPVSTPSRKYGVVPRASMRRSLQGARLVLRPVNTVSYRERRCAVSCKARDRGVLGEYGEEAERGRSGCSGVRMQAYLWDGVLRTTSRAARRMPVSRSRKASPRAPALCRKPAAAGPVPALWCRARRRSSRSRSRDRS